MVPRTPSLIEALLLAGLLACYDGQTRDADTASPPESDTDTDADADSDTDTDIDDTGDEPSDPATTGQICETLLELCEDGWGWDSLRECTEGWLGEGQDWACADSEGYLICVASCLDSPDCDSFGSCEVPCWDGHCL
jgi:hypothetical protein